MSRERFLPLLKRPAPLLEALTSRPRLLGGQVIGVHGVDASLEAMKEAKRSEWRAKGYPEGLIDMGVSLADEWSSSMAEAFAPPELKETVVRHVYPKGLDVAGRWISKMAGP